VKTVYLHGQLGKRFGKKWEVAANTPTEIIQALEANSEGFLQYICKKANEGENYVFIKKDPKKITSENDVKESLLQEYETQIKYQNQEIHVVSQAYGGFVASFIASTFMTSAFAASTLGAAIAGGIASAVWGVVAQFAMNALFKPPKPPARKDPTSTKSFLMSGASTRQAQGIAVPLGYGRLKIGPANVAINKANKKINSTKNASVLESYTEMEFLDVLCEGPIEGFVNKYGGVISGGDIREGIFLNDVQVKSTESGQYNYILNEKEDSADGAPAFKDGQAQDKTIIADKVYSVKDYDTLLYGGGPYDANGSPGSHYGSISIAKTNGAKVISHFVSNRSVGKVTFSFKAELAISNDDGSTSENNVRFALLVSRRDGEYNILDSSSGCSIEYQDKSGLTTVGNDYNAYMKLKGIATGTYQFDLHIKYSPEINSSEISGGVTFKLIKLSREYDQSVKGGSVGGIAKTRRLQLAHVAETIDEKLLYPSTAMVRLLIDGKNFPSAPDRNYHLKLKKVLIPENYNPVSRKYDGPWNGLFKGQTDAAQSINEISDANKYWTDNPAWVFFDLLHNTRYGIGKYGLEESSIDKWQLYKVAKYCDELVETNYPIETSTSLPLAFSSSGQASDGVFDVKFEGSFGRDVNFIGKKVAFFIFQHSYGSGDLTTSQRSTITQKSINREGEIIIEERTILRYNASSGTITLYGPNFGDNVAAFGPTNTVLGACAIQINHPIVEPRFTANLLLTDRSEAMQIINSMSSIFRGMASYIGGKISVTNDSFKNPIQLFNNSNVIDSEFQYSGVLKNKKVTAAMVRFNNKDKNFKPDLVYEEDATSMQSLGYIENETMGFGITSESQARRLAKWILLTSQLETETIKFVAGQEASYLLPGYVFEVSDEARTNTDKSGRVLDVQLYRNRNIINDNEIKENVNIYDPYILIDKDNVSTPSYSRIELTVYSGQTNETLKDIDRRSSFEKSEDDQDSEIESLRTPQISRFEGSIYTDPSINVYGPQGQKTIVGDLTLKLPIELSVSDNQIKIYNHGFSDGEKVYFTTDGVLPGGIKSVDSGIANYYIINSTKHTFKISESSGGSEVNIFSVGKDRFGNLGGLHYVVTNSHSRLNDALDQINLGAVYSIKGLIGVATDQSISLEEKIALGISQNYNNGWVKSDFLGTILIKGDWVYSVSLGWIYVKHLKDRVDDDFWFFIQDVGWVWTNSENRNQFWWIESLSYSTTNKFVYVLYNNSSRELINGLFVYDDSAQSGHADRLTNGENYLLGSNKKMSIRKISSSTPIGYFLSNQEEFNYYVEPNQNQPSPVEKQNPNYISGQINRIYRINSEQSIQGENAVVVELRDGHAIDLNKIGKLTVYGLTGNIGVANDVWHIAPLDENVFELIDSASIYNDAPDIGGSGSIVSNGYVSFIASISSLVDRFLEGQLFRTLGVKEISENKYEVTGLEYNYSKFFAVDRRGVVRPPSLPIPPQADMSIPEAPDGLLLFDLTV
jgi:predicted phage tail protein